jgi:hypothetical protein
VLNRIAPKIKVFGNKEVNKSEFFTTARQSNILHRNFSRLAYKIGRSSPRADDEFGDGILGNQKFKKMYYLNVSESGIDSR